MPSDTEIRDQLALDRTHLANERTLLAYVRTALALAGAGAGLIQFFDTSSSHATGWVLIALGVLGLLVGAWRFLTVRRHLSARPRDRAL
jgi:putative membrane protein